MATPNPDLAHNRERVREWFAATPGYWRPLQVANALGVTEPRARVRLYNELARLARDGVLSKLEAPPAPGKVRPIALYGAPPPTTPGHGGRRDRKATT